MRHSVALCGHTLPCATWVTCHARSSSMQSSAHPGQVINTQWRASSSSHRSCCVCISFFRLVNQVGKAGSWIPTATLASGALTGLHILEYRHSTPVRPHDYPLVIA